ncbi:MAG: hypothetical protein IT380_21195 [Myxococcales bacterium]|nr:hypothetical protein [Myxococcales bacterium]
MKINRPVVHTTPRASAPASTPRAQAARATGHSDQSVFESPTHDSGRVKGQYNRGQKIHQNQARIGAGLQWGYSLEQQGVKNVKEQGQAAYQAVALKGKLGTFAPLSWDTKIINGQVYLRPRSHQVDRLKEWGDPTRWKHASEVLNPGHAAAVQRGFERQQAFNAAHKDLSPIEARQAFVMESGLRKHIAGGLLKKDEATGLWVNRAGEAWNKDGSKSDVFIGDRAKVLFGE